MNYEFFKVKVSKTESFDEYLKLIEKEVKKFVQDIDLKTYGQTKQLFHTLTDPLKELKNENNLQWDKDSTGQDLFMDEVKSVTEKTTSHNCRESIAIVVNKEFANEYTLVNSLSTQEVKQLELNFNQTLIKVVTGMYDFAPQQEEAEANQDCLLTQKIEKPVEKKNTMKMG